MDARLAATLINQSINPKNGGGTINKVLFPESDNHIGQPFSSGQTRFSDTLGGDCRDGQTPPSGSKGYFFEPTFCVVSMHIHHLASTIRLSIHPP